MVRRKTEEVEGHLGRNYLRRLDVIEVAVFGYSQYPVNNLFKWATCAARKIRHSHVTPNTRCFAVCSRFKVFKQSAYVFFGVDMLVHGYIILLVQCLLSRLPLHGAEFAGLEGFDYSQCFGYGAAYVVIANSNMTDKTGGAYDKRATIGHALFAL